jgi:hypothetical protein
VELLALVVARAVEIYLAVGLVFAIAFAARGVEVVDPAARNCTRGFRIVIVPGAIALWPLLLRRWLGREPTRKERNVHRSAALGGDA